jgi:hypothetical protein
MGIEAGAVMYHTSFPARFEGLKILEAAICPSALVDNASKPEGGEYLMEEMAAAVDGGGAGVTDFLQGIIRTQAFLANQSWKPTEAIDVLLLEAFLG